MAIPLLQEFQTLRQGTLISVLQPERSCYDLTAFRQLALPEVHNVSPATFIKTARHEVVLNKRDETGSREKLKRLID